MPMGYLLVYTALSSIALAVIFRMIHGFALAFSNTSNGFLAILSLGRLKKAYKNRHNTMHPVEVVKSVVKLLFINFSPFNLRCT